MFGLFSRKAAPLELEATATINAPAATIFALVDFSTPANRLAARGFQFSRRPGGPDLFSAKDPNMPDLTFEFDVDLNEYGKAYGFNSRILADAPFGAFESNREEYHITEIDARSCRVMLKTTSWWRKGVNGRQRSFEEETMTQAVTQDLAKLKIEAETGAAANAA